MLKKERSRGGLLKKERRTRGVANAILTTTTISTNQLLTTHPPTYTRSGSKKIGGGGLNPTPLPIKYPRLKNRGRHIQKDRAGLERLVGCTGRIERDIERGKLHRDCILTYILNTFKHILLGSSIFYVLPFIGEGGVQEEAGEENRDKGLISFFSSANYKGKRYRPIISLALSILSIGYQRIKDIVMDIGIGGGERTLLFGIKN